MPGNNSPPNSPTHTTPPVAPTPPVAQTTTINLENVIITETTSTTQLPAFHIDTENVVSQPLNPSNVNLTLNQTLTGDGYVITNQQGSLPDGTEVTKTTFISSDPENHIPNIVEDLTETVTKYYDDEQTGPSSVLINQIKDYAVKIKCSDFHGKGTIEDYNELFVAAAKIANESKQMQLNVDIDGFAEFGQAADDLSALFNSFIVKLQRVSIINDTVFLQAVVSALEKIWNLSEIFGRFKDTILATSTVQLPKSASDTSSLLNDVMVEVNCALGYINHFVNPSDSPNLNVTASLSSQDKNIIDKAVSTIDNWNVLCDQGVSIAMTNNPDIQNIKKVNNDLKMKTTNIQNATNLLKAKFAQFNIHY